MSTVPITILAGSDLRPGELPEEGAGQHPLAAYKGASVEVHGRPILAHLVERLRASAGFGPVSIAGPAREYEPLLPGVRVIDTDADVASNVRAAIDDFLAAKADGPFAMMACDVLPTTEELDRLFADYRASAPCDAWFPLVRVPPRVEEIGAFAWKPEYGIVPEPGAEPVQVLPGHLMVFDPRALRLPLMYRLLELAYRTRNKPIETRKRAMVGGLVFELLRQDVLHVFSLRVPDLTFKVVTSGLTVARRLRAGAIERAELEHHIGRITIKARHRRRYPERGIRLPVVDVLSLAEDVDTEEEARELERVQPPPEA